MLKKTLLCISMAILFMVSVAARTTITDTGIITPKITAREFNSVFVVDGNNDDAIQAAIDAANANVHNGWSGGIVYIPPGSYRLYKPILLYDNVHLKGVRKATYLSTTPGGFTGDALFKSATRDVNDWSEDITVSISDMTIKAEGTQNNGNGVIGIDMTGWRDSRIVNVDLWGSGLWEGTAIVLGDTVDDPNNPGVEIANKTTFFNYMENIDGGTSGNWKTFFRLDQRRGNANHNYGIGIMASAEAIIDYPNKGGPPGLALLGCYWYGPGFGTVTKNNFMPLDMDFIDCTNEPKAFDDDMLQQYAISGKAVIENGGIELGLDSPIFMGPMDIKTIYDNAPASAKPIPPLLIANTWRPSLRLAEASFTGDSSDLMYSRYFDIEMIYEAFGLNYKLKIAPQNDSSKGIIMDAQGRVGIGTETPVQKLDIDGLLRLIPTDSPGTCDSTTEGAIYFDDSLSEPCFCNSLSWNQFYGGGIC